MDPSIHVLDGDRDTLRKRAIFLREGAFLGSLYSIGTAVDDRLKSLRDSDKRPGNTNHGVVDLVVVQYSGPGNTNHRVVDLVVVELRIAAVLREVRAVPVGHDVAGVDTHCSVRASSLCTARYDRCKRDTARIC